MNAISTTRAALMFAALPLAAVAVSAQDQQDRYATEPAAIVTGVPPTEKQQEHFDKQLFLLAAMAEHSGF